MATKNSNIATSPSGGASNNAIITAVLVLGLVGAAFFIGTLWTKVQQFEGGNARNAPSPTQPVETGEPVAIEVSGVTETDHIFGNPDARIALIEYSDFSCPFCQSFHATAKQVVEAYNGEVMWVFRQFPIDSIHPNARKEAQASECAAKLGGNDAFWEMADAIYANQPGLTKAALPGLATSIGLDGATFTECLDSGETNEMVQAQIQTGVDAGIRGTPGNIILDTETGEYEIVAGALPLENMKRAIDGVLAK